jgi:hypothetical protein
MKNEDAGMACALLVGLTIILISLPTASAVYAGDAVLSTTPHQATYSIGKWVMASGGTLGAASQNYLHYGTVGQTTVGGSQSANNILVAGFWLVPLIPTGVAPWGRTDMPTTYVLYQNYPNPFNPTTTIRYGLPQKSNVTLSVFNTFGQQVALFSKGDVDAGYHELQFNAERLASGVYFFRLQAGNYVETKKLLLLR